MKRDYKKSAEIIQSEKFRIQTESDNKDRLLREFEVMILGLKKRCDLLQTRVDELENAAKPLVNLVKNATKHNK